MGRCLPKAAAVWDGDVNIRMYHIFVNYLCFFKEIFSYRLMRLRLFCQRL